MSDEAADRIKRASENKRAWRIRKIAEDQRTDEQRTWLAEYEHTVRISRGQEAPADDAAPAETPTEPVEPPPAPPPPPRVASDAGQPTEESVPKKKKAAKDDGRDRAVKMVAGQWIAALKFMSSQIEESGGTPVFKVEDLEPHIVTTVDDMLPESVTIKPQHIAAIGTTAIIAQRVMRRKKIAEFYEQKRHQPQPEPPREPPPKPEEPPAPGPDVPVTPNGLALEAPIIQLAPDMATEWVPGKGDVV